MLKSTGSNIKNQFATSKVGKKVRKKAKNVNKTSRKCIFSANNRRWVKKINYICELKNRA